MEPFSITCLTCRKRLKVRDPQLVGLILACPSCGAMVQVTPPPGWQPSAPDAPPAAEASAAPAAADASTPAAATLVAATAPTESIAAPVPEAPALAASTASMPAVPAEPLLARPAGYLAPAEQLWLRMARLAVYPLVALLTAALMFGVVRSLRSDQQTAPDDEVATAAAAAPSAGEPPAPPAVAQADPTPATAPTQANDGQPASDRQPNTPANGANAETSNAESNKNRDAPESAEPAPADGALASLPMSPSPSEPPSDDVDGSPHPKRSPHPSTAGGEPDTADPAPPEGPQWAAPGEGFPRPIIRFDILPRLEDRIDGIRLSGMPLSDFVTLVSQMIAAPATIDIDALRAAGCKLDSPVQVELRDCTIGQLLEAGLAPLELAFQVVDGHWIVTSRQFAQAQIESRRYDVSDLAADAAALNALRDMAQDLLRGGGRNSAAVSLESVPPATLVLEGLPARHALLCELLDRLRLARGGRTLSADKATAVALESRWLQLGPRLQTPVTASFGRPDLLVEIVRHLEAAAGIAIVIDWSALATLGLTPEAELTLVVTDQPLAEALAHLADALELGWRAIDNRTLLLTTRGAVVRHDELEFYRVSDLLHGSTTIDALVERIKEQVAGSSWDDAGGTGLIGYDSASGYLIVRQCQPVQIAVERLLDAMR